MQIVPIAALLLGVVVARAEIKVVPAEIDLGRRRQELTIESTVTLTNTGSTIEKISQVGADCSCTAATPEKTTLAPGESTQMKVSFQTHRSQGEVHRRVSVLLSSGSELIIPLKAVVSSYDDWTFASSVAMLPPTNKGQEAKVSFTVTYSGKANAEISGFQSEAKWLQAKVVGHHENVWTLELIKMAGAPAGNLQPILRVSTTDAHEPTIEVPVFASVYSILLVKPNPILLPVTKVGQPIAMNVSIAGWEPKEDPRGEIEEGKFVFQQRDHRDVLMKIEVTPQRVGVSTRLLRIYAGDNLEAEVPTIVRAEGGKGE